MSASDASSARESSSGEMSGRELGEQGDDPDLTKYRKYVMKSKDALRSDNLHAAVLYLKKAFAIYASTKLEMKIKTLEEALKASISSDEEDDEYINVLGSGLHLFHELHDLLYAHQREGVAWLYNLFKNKGKGGILADDMGLGKTIQIISFLAGMFDSSRIRSVLLVMPTTLLSNWVAEFEKWAPGICIRTFHGTKSERTRNLQKVKRTQGVVLTTYQLVVNNWQELSTYQGQEFTWDAIILDEGHKIKSASTKTAKTIRAIPAKFRVVLTGTPVQNNLKELWALFDFACEGSLLGTSKTFNMEYENPITKARQKDATVGEKVLGSRMAENLQQLIKPYFLRRTKAEVQSKERREKQLQDDKENDPGAGNSAQRVQIAMPTMTRKNDLIVWVYLSPVQEKIYKDFHNLDDIKQLLDSRRSPLAALGVLKKVCVHPRLLPERACAQLGLNQQFGRNVPERHENNWFLSSLKYVPAETLIQESGKLTFLVGLLERLRQEGHRILVFSQSLKMLHIVNHILTMRGFKVMRIDGTVTHISERDKRVRVFQEGSEFNVFLLTTQVGGVGLTLTAANRVVILDPSWNPATDAQAVDRAYRIGQTDNVVIYRLITCGTMEEKIYRRQIFKDSLIRQTTGDKKNPFRYFSQQELRELFILEDTRMSKTQIQLQSLHSAQRKSDTTLDEHIAYLHTLEMFGLSDHDLMYSCEETSVETLEEEGAHYIEQKVRKAQEIVAAESHVHQQFRKQILAGTEPPRGLYTGQERSKGDVRNNKPRPEPEWEDEIGSNEALMEPAHRQNEPDIYSISQDITDLTLEDNAGMKISKIGMPLKDFTIQVEACTTGDVDSDAEINSMIEEGSRSVLNSRENSLTLLERNIQSVVSEPHLFRHSQGSFRSESNNSDDDEDHLFAVKRTKTRIIESDSDDDIQRSMSAYMTSHEKRKSNTSTLSQAMVHGSSSPACEVLPDTSFFKTSKRRSVSAHLSVSKVFDCYQHGDSMAICSEEEDFAIPKIQLENFCKDEKNLQPCHQENVMQSQATDMSADIVSDPIEDDVSSFNDFESEKSGSCTTSNYEACSFKPMQLDNLFSSEKTPDLDQAISVKLSKEKCSLRLISSLLEDENESPSQLMGLQRNRLVLETPQENTSNISLLSSSASEFNLVLDESEQEEEAEGEEEEEEGEDDRDDSDVKVSPDVDHDAEINSMIEESHSVLKSRENSLSHVESDIQNPDLEPYVSRHSQASFSSESESEDVVNFKRTKTRRVLESDDDEDVSASSTSHENVSAYSTSHEIRQSHTSTPTRAMVHGKSLPEYETEQRELEKDAVSKEEEFHTEESSDMDLESQTGETFSETD